MTEPQPTGPAHTAWLVRTFDLAQLDGLGAVEVYLDVLRKATPQPGGGYPTMDRYAVVPFPSESGLLRYQVWGPNPENNTGTVFRGVIGRTELFTALMPGAPAAEDGAPILPLAGITQIAVVGPEAPPEHYTFDPRDVQRHFWRGATAGPAAEPAVAVERPATRATSEAVAAWAPRGEEGSCGAGWASPKKSGGGVDARQYARSIADSNDSVVGTVTAGALAGGAAAASVVSGL